MSMDSNVGDIWMLDILLIKIEIDYISLYEER